MLFQRNIRAKQGFQVQTIDQIQNIMRRLLIYIKQKCAECFRDHPNILREDENELRSSARLIQMKPIQPNEEYRIQQQQSISLNKQYRINTGSLSWGKFHKTSSKQLFDSNSKISHEQFFSIEEFKSQQGQISRRSFKIGTLQKISSQNEVALWKSQTSTQNNPIIIDYSNSEQCKLISQTEKLLNWINQQYKIQDSIHRFQVSHAMRLKTKGNGMMSLLVHKLEDFKISYLPQSVRAFNFTNKSKSMLAYFQMNEVGSSSRRIYNVSSYYRIECSIMQIGELLKTFKSKEMLRILHNFTHVCLANMETGCSGLQFPIFTAKSHSRKHKKSRKIHIAWQMGQVQFEDEQGRQIFEIGFSLDEGDESWQRIIKYSISNKGYIQIYFQCHEQGSLNDRQSFSSRFLAIEVFLLKKKIIEK